MKVLAIESIERHELPIDYRRQYAGTAVIGVGDSAEFRAPIEFTLELSPFGSHDIAVRFLTATDFPLVPALRILKDAIRELESAGRLP